MSEFHRPTDRQTDRETDRQTVTSSDAHRRLTVKDNKYQTLYRITACPTHVEWPHAQRAYARWACSHGAGDTGVRTVNA